MKVYILRQFITYEIPGEDETRADTIECVATSIEDCLDYFSRHRKMIKKLLGSDCIITDDTMSALIYAAKNGSCKTSITWNIETHDLLQEGEGA